MNFKENESATKLRGGYYTPPEIAKFLLRWVLTASPKTLLEPSCGNGTFFHVLTELDYSSLESVVGFEIEPYEARKSEIEAAALKNLDCKITNGDFLGWALSQFQIAPLFDAIVGNPPFVRYQYLDKKTQAITQAIYKHLRLNVTKHANAWVAFVVASLALLNRGGRFAMVIPSELIHILYAEPLRAYLAQTCSRILIFDPQELWFENTLQGAILLLAEKKETVESKSYGVSIIQTRDKSFLSQNPENFFQQAKYANGETVQGKWTLAFLSDNERRILKDTQANVHVHSFDSIADVAVGIVTGANKFFLVPDTIVRQYDLSEWAHPMFGRSDHVPGIIYDKTAVERNRQLGLPTNFIWFPKDVITVLPAKVQEYIQFGESQGLHTRYKCRIRTPWYSVPSVYSTSVGMLKRCHDFPRLIFNKVEAFTTDTAYRIKLKSFDSASLVYSYINSLTALTAELEGRHYGGGVLELVPSEIRRLLIPIKHVSEKEVYQLDNLFRCTSSSEDILAQQDKTLLMGIGFSKQTTDELGHAWLKLKQRRQRQPLPPETVVDEELEAEFI